MKDSIFAMYAIGIPLVLFLIYLTIRLGAAAFYRSKKEFAIWYKTHIGNERKGESE